MLSAMNGNGLHPHHSMLLNSHPSMSNVAIAMAMGSGDGLVGQRITAGPDNITVLIIAAPDANIQPGQPVTGAGLAAGTTVVSYSSVSPGSITVSAPITAALSSTAIELDPRTNSLTLAAQSLTHGSASLSAPNCTWRTSDSAKLPK